MLFSAPTFDKLHERLPDLNVSVPARPAPRETTPEIYSIVRLLGSVPLAPNDFPLHLVKGERPDFALYMGARSIGIEHTEAVPENVAHESTLRAALGRDAYLMRGAVVGEPRKSRKQLLAEIEEDRMPPPMMGDSVERGGPKRWPISLTARWPAPGSPVTLPTTSIGWRSTITGQRRPSSASSHWSSCRSVWKRVQLSRSSSGFSSLTSACWSTLGAIARCCTA